MPQRPKRRRVNQKEFRLEAKANPLSRSLIMAKLQRALVGRPDHTPWPRAEIRFPATGFAVSKGWPAEKYLSELPCCPSRHARAKTWCVRLNLDSKLPKGAWVLPLVNVKTAGLFEFLRGRRRAVRLDWSACGVWASDRSTRLIGVARLGYRRASPYAAQGTLLKLNEMSLKEASTAYGTSIASVKINVHRAAKTLRKILGDRSDLVPTSLPLSLAMLRYAAPLRPTPWHSWAAYRSPP